MLLALVSFGLGGGRLAVTIRRGTSKTFFLGPRRVQGEQPGKHFVAKFVAPAVAPGLSVLG
jgi:hypothetical protein